MTGWGLINEMGQTASRETKQIRGQYSFLLKVILKRGPTAQHKNNVFLWCLYLWCLISHWH